VLHITRLLLLCFGDRGNPAQSLGSDPERDRLFSSLGLCYDAVPLWRFICGSENDMKSSGSVSDWVTK